MVFLKNCPICKSPNSPDDMMCKNCLGDISGVRPIEVPEKNPAAKQMPEGDKTILLRQECIFFRAPDGKRIKVEHGKTLGRHEAGMEILAKYDTVSRQHARVTFENGKWYIEDLNSSNGTYLDGVRITPGKKTELKSNQKCSLSNSFETVVLMK